MVKRRRPQSVICDVATRYGVLRAEELEERNRSVSLEPLGGANPGCTWISTSTTVRESFLFLFIYF
jgi:hypothetical protein